MRANKWWGENFVEYKELFWVTYTGLLEYDSLQFWSIYKSKQWSSISTEAIKKLLRSMWIRMATPEPTTLPYSVSFDKSQWIVPSTIYEVSCQKTKTNRNLMKTPDLSTHGKYTAQRSVLEGTMEIYSTKCRSWAILQVAGEWRRNLSIKRDLKEMQVSLCILIWRNQLFKKIEIWTLNKMNVFGNLIHLNFSL